MAYLTDEERIIYRVQNDTGPDEQFPLYRLKRDGRKLIPEVLDVTADYSARFVIKSKTTGTITNTGHQTCTIVPSTNTASYSFQAGDLPDAGGDYECDFELTDPSGKVETAYDRIVIRTRAEIAA